MGLTLIIIILDYKGSGCDQVAGSLLFVGIVQ